MEAQLAVLELTDQAKAERQVQLETRYQDLQAKRQEVEQPFRDRIDAAHDEMLPADADDRLRDLIAAATKSHDGFTPQIGTVRADTGFISCQWNNDAGDRLAWSHIRLREAPSEESDQLAGTYPVRSHRDDSIWVWAGHFLITFVGDDDHTWDREKIAKTVQACVDLEKLAAIEPVATQESVNP